mmetsp:Transcript_32784/g.47867  ORF Transcript_32784/g.47867 Transcript_32784/m.47867 type:complete len:151 (+) Transcript_32784:81-533(+)
MIRQTTIAVFFALASVSSAFTTPMLNRPALLASPTKLGLMTPEEEVAIMTSATDCAEGECSLDEVDALISELKEQQATLSKRVGEMEGLIKNLKSLNTKDDREVDEVRETVRAIFRVFQLGVSTTYSSFSEDEGYVKLIVRFDESLIYAF